MLLHPASKNDGPKEEALDLQFLLSLLIVSGSEQHIKDKHTNPVVHQTQKQLDDEIHTTRENAGNSDRYDVARPCYCQW